MYQKITSEGYTVYIYGSLYHKAYVELNSYHLTLKRQALFASTCEFTCAHQRCKVTTYNICIGELSSSEAISLI